MIHYEADKGRNPIHPAARPEIVGNESLKRVFSLMEIARLACQKAKISVAPKARQKKTRFRSVSTLEKTIFRVQNVQIFLIPALSVEFLIEPPLLITDLGRRPTKNPFFF